MPPSVPRIGVTTFRELVHWDSWNLQACLVPVQYSDAIRDAGGLAVLLPPSPPELARVALDGLHGLLISGGPDVDPGRYGQERHHMTGTPRDARDQWELALVREAMVRDLPLLAVCRGMQILNIALGGTLVQHLPDLVKSDRHAPLTSDFGRHRVRLSGGSRLASLLGEHAEVATSHHQAIDRLGAGLTVCGRAEDDVIEAVELRHNGWTIGVQWHPEIDGGQALFAALVEACAPASSAATPVLTCHSELRGTFAPHSRMRSGASDDDRCESFTADRPRSL